jgi:hypothetical protein
LNRIDQTLNSATGQQLGYDFDAPTVGGTTGSLGADKESLMANGDSGGPTFLNDNGTLKIAGVHSMVLDFNGNGNWPDYGDKGRDIRISTYASWIKSLLPKPGDANLDGLVNDTDVNILMGNWGKTDATWFQGDFNLDKIIDADDMNILLDNKNQ